MTDNSSFDDIFDNQNDEPQRPRRKKKRVWRKVLVGVLVVVVLGVLGVGVYLWNVGRTFDDKANQLSDEQVFGTQSPTANKQEGGTNILLLGSDEPMKNVDVNSSRGLRSDSIMVMHLPENGSNVQVMSIPRDSWVNIEGQGKAKINAALSYGGLPLAVKTVSDFIGTPIDMSRSSTSRGSRDSPTASAGSGSTPSRRSRRTATRSPRARTSSTATRP